MSKKEKKIGGIQKNILSICLLSSIEKKYNDLALTLVRGSVNILNMSTGSILKIADVPVTYGFYSDSMMQIMRNNNEETFSFVFIGKDRKEICKMTVRKKLANLCLE